MKVAIINDTRSTHHFGCMLVMENLLGLLQKQGAEIAWTWPVSVDWRKRKRKIKAMPDVDAIIINGEGTIHHNEERRFSQALIDLVEFAKDELNIPCYVINATLYANSQKAYQKLANARAIYVRDKGSLKELEETGRLQGAYVPDLTFAANTSHKKPTGLSDASLVIDSAVKGDASYLQSYAENQGYDYRSMIVARLSTAKFLRSPRPWVRNLIKWLKTDRKLATDAASYIHYLQQYGWVITGRYHTVTMCMKNRIPFLALESNTPKVSYLLTDVLGSVERSFTPEKLDQCEEGHLKAFTPAELDSISDFTAKSEVAIQSMMSTICDDIKAGAKGDYHY